MEQQSAELVDFVIAHWTDIDPYESMERIDASHNAQFTAKKELPQSRLGFFPDTVKILASIIDSKYKIPASVTLAQWALESSWGKNNLGVSNYFGHTFPATGRFTQLNRWVTRTETIHNKRT
ncbi:MAG: glucosaminidase domain-containing protein, partial [Ignavibacteriales bacterium]|nr:glucosaminidase domain-containing protein [Ignavibacteriales bacterium]